VRHIVTFLVSTPDECTDTVQAFAEDTAHLYAPPYVGVIDYAVRVDVPSCFVLPGSQAASDVVDEALEEALRGRTWAERARDEIAAGVIASGRRV
jgi:hypothetical protein